MSKINNQSNSLYNIDFVQDISPETAADYSGGAGLVFDGTGDIVLHKDAGQQGAPLGVVDAEIGEDVGISAFADGRSTGFNDQVSSFTVNEGTWQFFTEAGLEGNSGFLNPGTVGDFGENNDAITSIVRIA
ncbi:MAG: beta/gamma crystallin-related protein [Waterburya sp.]